jgi:hypothetical protein
VFEAEVIDDALGIVGSFIVCDTDDDVRVVPGILPDPETDTDASPFVSCTIVGEIDTAVTQSSSVILSVFVA